MRQWVRVMWMVLAGILGGWVGYWLGHLVGWSQGAEWPLHVGGGSGAILTSIGLALLGVLLARLAVGPRPATPAPEPTSEVVPSGDRS